MADLGCRVIVAGLDLDFEGQPFGPIPHLMAVADQVTKLLVVCTTCGEPASKTQRIAGGLEVVEVGGKEQYETRCRQHWKHS